MIYSHSGSDIKLFTVFILPHFVKLFFILGNKNNKGQGNSLKDIVLTAPNLLSV